MCTSLKRKKMVDTDGLKPFSCGLLTGQSDQKAGNLRLIHKNEF